MNAEYAEKIQLLANCFVNGPQLGQDQAKRLKFVEMIRQLSKAALEVLAFAVQNPTDTRIVDSGEVAGLMEWDPHLVNSCVQELGAIGVLSSIRDWTRDGTFFRKSLFGDKGQLMITELTQEFARFISSESRE